MTLAGSAGLCSGHRAGVNHHPVATERTVKTSSAVSGLVSDPGTILKTCSESFRQRFDEADLIVARGQGNFESLSDNEKRVFFLRRPKCAVLARHLGCDIGGQVVRQGGPKPSADAAGDEKMRTMAGADE